MSEAVKAAQIRSDNNHYSKGARQEWREEEGRIKESFAADLAAEYMPYMPKAVTDLVFSRAWEEGHSAGYSSVAGEYEALTDFVMAIKDELE